MTYNKHSSYFSPVCKIAKQLRNLNMAKLTSLKPLYLGSIMIVQFLLKCSCNRVYTHTKYGKVNFG